MEELKQKVAKQNAFIDKMRENIILNRNNFSSNEKVSNLEELFEKNDFLRNTDKIA